MQGKINGALGQKKRCRTWVECGLTKILFTYMYEINGGAYLKRSWGQNWGEGQ